MLWWLVHEPEAADLGVGDKLQAVFERGIREAPLTGSRHCGFSVDQSNRRLSLG